jgi:hypothetical protein
LYLIKQLNARILIQKPIVSQDFMEPEDSLQFSQEPDTLPYPEPDECRRQIHIPFVEYEIITAMIMKFLFVEVYRPVVRWNSAEI